jgi:hypothetical protein
MTITITIDNIPVAIRVIHYLPPEPPEGLYGHSSAPEVEWEGPDWLHAVADHFNLWAQIDRLVLEGIIDAAE